MLQKKKNLLKEHIATLGLFNQHDDYQLFTECNSIKDLGLQLRMMSLSYRGKFEACFVAFPSSWNAGEKVGKTLNELHEPIADNEALVRASEGNQRSGCQVVNHFTDTLGAYHH